MKISTNILFRLIFEKVGTRKIAQYYFSFMDISQNLMSRGEKLRQQTSELISPLPLELCSHRYEISKGERAVKADIVEGRARF